MASALSDKQQAQPSTVAVPHDEDSAAPSGNGTKPVPLKMRILSVVLVSMIGFGGHWSSGLTGALKSTLKKELHITNTQFAVLDSSENFIKTALILVSGMLTDRYGGASTMFWGNAVFSGGAILVAVAATRRNYGFIIGGVVVQALGDVATQVAQYKVFSSWFAPAGGFAATLALELAVGKLGAFAGKATANVLAQRLGDFSWAYWVAVGVNLATNAATAGFWVFTRWSGRRYSGVRDPATGEALTESNRRFELARSLYLPWPFWLVCLFSLFQTATAGVFASNGTELAEQRFDVSAVRAGWYASSAQYLGFFLVPLVGIFVDVVGQRLTVMLVCGAGMALSMGLAAWGPTVGGTAASFGVFAVASALGPTAVIDGVRTAMWHQDVFGAAYAVKIAVNNSMTILVGVLAGALQDRDAGDGYARVTVLYVALAVASVVVGVVMVVLGRLTPTLGHLQWSRKRRIANGPAMAAAKHAHEHGAEAGFFRRLAHVAFGAVILLILGAWAAYFWGIATGNS